MTLPRWLRLSPPATAVVIAASAAFAACVGDDPNAGNGGPVADASPSPEGASSQDGATSPPVDGGGDVASNAPTLTLTPARPRVLRGGQTAVELKVDRRGLDGDVAVSATGLPSGVTVANAVVPAASSTTTLTFVATASAKMGNAPVTIKAVGAADLTIEIVVAGAPGTLDESFDNDGIVLDTPAATGGYYAVAVQSDGKLLTAGTTAPPNSGWLIRRFDANGAPDSAFNAAAAAAVPTTGAARGIALDPATGRIVVVGGSGSTERLTILRLNADGTADQAFANVGTMVADSVAHPQGSLGNAARVLADSSIVVAGTKGTLALVERYTAQGVRDGNFVAYTSANAAAFTGLALLPSGAFIAGGTDVNASPDAQLVVRLLGNGTPDALFNGGARTYASGCRGAALAIASNGDAIVVGDDQTAPVACLTRVQASGTGDLGFTKSVGGGSGAKFYAAAPGPNGASYAAAQFTGTYDNSAYIERRLTNGELDPLFGTGGVVTLEDPATPDTYKYVPAAALTADGRLVVVGRRPAPSSGPPFIVRFWE